MMGRGQSQKPLGVGSAAITDDVSFCFVKHFEPTLGKDDEPETGVVARVVGLLG